MIRKSDLLKQFPGGWTVYWLLLPNIAIILMWPIGGPSMRAPLVVYGVLALAVSQMPWRSLRTLGIVALTLWTAMNYVASMFLIPALNFAMINQFLMDVRPLHAPEYLVAGLILAAILVVLVWKAPAVPRFTRPLHFLLAIAALLVFVNTDTVVTARSKGDYRPIPENPGPFDSAVLQAGLTPAGAGQRHVVLIVVEALGMPVQPEETQLLNASWNRPEWRGRYDVRMGSTLYFGPTTSGELRELCGRWSHHTMFDFSHADCLPARFRKAGYHASALHSFGGDFFERASWYPKLAFEKIEFADNLAREGVTTCGGVFPGACDTEVAALIGRRLARAESPQFVYWLTLNSHLPLLTRDPKHDSPCRLGTPAWREAYPMVCRLFQTHAQLADAIGSVAMSPDLPPTDFLIVGDHKPPFFDRTSRARFDEARVPWIYLRSLDSRAPARTPGSRADIRPLLR